MQRQNSGKARIMKKRQLLCVMLGMGAAVCTYFADEFSSPLQNGYVLERAAYGQGELRQQLLVEGLESEPVPVDLLIGERQYTEEEAEAVFAEAEEILPRLLKGENTSLLQVRTRLYFPKLLKESGVSVRWYRDDTELIGEEGEIYGESCAKEGEETGLTAVLTAGNHTRTLSYQVIVYPPERTEEERRRTEFLKLLEQMEKNQSTEACFFLPEEYDGRQLRYRTEPELRFLLFPVLGLIAAFLLPLLEKQKGQEKQREREHQLMTDYPEIVSKLLVYFGAGLPVRQAWERIVKEYEGGSREESRAAYEEMAVAFHQMQRGIPERRAYHEFGNRCRLLPYRKLASLLEQNIRKGSEQLKSLLEVEMEEAFEQRKQLARRRGEEASTKLLIPLFLLLLVVMVMVSVPAFLSFGM